MTNSATMPDVRSAGAATAADIAPTWFIDSAEPSVVAFATTHAGSGNARDKAVRLTRAVRDAVRYDPYSFRLNPARYKASWCLAQPSAFCVPKAILLAAVARAVGIPARLGYADVRNHLASSRLAAMMGSDLFRWHGYTALFLDNRWVKATPAFDLGLCRRFGVLPLEFDGSEDSIFHPYAAGGRRHMEYVRHIGEFSDFPYETFASDMRQHYAPLLAMLEEQDSAQANTETPTQFAPGEH